MDIGTTVLHTDTDDNTFAGQICGRDFEMRPVFRAKDGTIRRNPDGTLSDKSHALTDTVKTEKVETGLFNVLATYRDGHQKLLLLDPSELVESPAFSSSPVFSHAPADEAPADDVGEKT